jgi:hypothetical protein
MMDKRILELALETLEKRKAAIDVEIQLIQTRMKGRARHKSIAPAVGKRKARTAGQRKAQSKVMKQIWAEKQAEAAKTATMQKPKRGPKNAAARKAQSERMKAYWAKKKAAKTKSGRKPA